MKKRILSVLMCVAMVATMLAGCGGSGDAGNAGNAAGTENAGNAANNVAEGAGNAKPEVKIDAKSQAKIDKLEKAQGKLKDMQTGFENKVDQSNLKIATKQLAKAEKQLEKFESLKDSTDPKLKAAYDAQAQKVADLQKTVDAGKLGDFEGATKIAGEVDSKFASKMEKGMQYGSFLQSAGSQFASRPTQTVGGGAHVGRPRGHHIQRRSFR